ncbi:phage holin family protein [Stutzerimonas stutzeri]|uniref:phage holin family protein n=1 Tax=Stutzerimonas stutzeri TaxID=316 RepID=UPI00265B1452|nr:phage holin family protein [Stutzerimonas stutzeri]MCF6780852.1 phage holin family protein [Stutzerimonas stutzeri]MCF6803422.1 phage holin family protein [Stutzerimonas stutzeri]
MDAKYSDEAPAPSLKKMGGALVGLLQGHLELIGIELQEERSRVFRLFLLASISLILGLLILVGLSAAVVIAFWESNPIVAILVLCVVYAIAVAICISRAIRLAKACASPFQATVEELARNQERLLP